MERIPQGGLKGFGGVNNPNASISRNDSVALQDQGNRGICYAHASARSITHFVFLYWTYFGDILIKKIRELIAEGITKDGVNWNPDDSISEYKIWLYWNIVEILVDVYGEQGAITKVAMQYILDNHFLFAERKLFKIVMYDSQDKKDMTIVYKLSKFGHTPVACFSLNQDDTTQYGKEKIVQYKCVCLNGTSSCIDPYNSCLGPKSSYKFGDIVNLVSGSEIEYECCTFMRISNDIGYVRVIVDERDFQTIFQPVSSSQWKDFYNSSTILQNYDIRQLNSYPSNPGGHAVVLSRFLYDGNNINSENIFSLNMEFKNSWGENNIHSTFISSCKNLCPPKSNDNPSNIISSSKYDSFNNFFFLDLCWDENLMKEEYRIDNLHGDNYMYPHLHSNNAKYNRINYCDVYFPSRDIAFYYRLKFEYWLEKELHNRTDLASELDIKSQVALFRGLMRNKNFISEDLLLADELIDEEKDKRATIRRENYNDSYFTIINKKYKLNMMENLNNSYFTITNRKQKFNMTVNLALFMLSFVIYFAIQSIVPYNSVFFFQSNHYIIDYILFILGIFLSLKYTITILNPFTIIMIMVILKEFFNGLFSISNFYGVTWVLFGGFIGECLKKLILLGEAAPV